MSRAKGESKQAQSGGFRVLSHPILAVVERPEISFTFNGNPMKAYEGEVVTTALFAGGVQVFGHHPRDGSPQGIFCANGQCSQCTVLVDGLPVKGCMVPVRAGMKIGSCEGSPALPADDDLPAFREIPAIETDVLIIGGGPAGINAAIELGLLGAKTLVVDDKNEFGGKLTLQTHTFFGSRDDCYAGTRGIEIARILTHQLERFPSVSVMLGTTAVGAFCDKQVGLQQGGNYFQVKPRAVLVACGAREKNLAFQGCDLPGVYGAGAFQTLLNRDLVRPTERLFIVGGGNVGLITGYHAIQAGIKVVGLVEALPRCGGYKVHLDKLRRLGVPIHTSHTILRAEGAEKLERITIAGVDGNFKPVAGTERSYRVDTLLIAVGLSPVNELYEKLVEYGIECYKAGDAEEIAEASAAIFSGKITGRKIARSLGYEIDIPDEWNSTAAILRSKPGRTAQPDLPRLERRVYPLIRCVQEIPCNPCADSCPRNSIALRGDSIMNNPVFDGDCIGCANCVAVCPGLAIGLIMPEYDAESKTSLLVLPYELDTKDLAAGRRVETVDMEGNAVGVGTIVAFRTSNIDAKRKIVSIEVPADEAYSVAGFAVLVPEAGESGAVAAEPVPDDTIICRCERITAGEVRGEIRAGVRDMNILKATIRTGMGACGGKTCTELILRLYREMDVDLSEVTLPTNRPFTAEVPLGVFAGAGSEGGEA
ncbi:MAG: FAD-dependent oxidoreductase [Candidatus Krumholzibacteria bacterium]|nr:FAD-dependent oxidoreductase [Candidatus Krumholzibacteria bacterium]